MNVKKNKKKKKEKKKWHKKAHTEQTFAYKLNIPNVCQMFLQAIKCTISNVRYI